MNLNKTTIKRALISVSDKTGIVELARVLVDHQIEIISTGGTSELLRQAGISVSDVADITGFPEIMDGRVKTLHPKIQGGILGQRDLHADVAAHHEIDWIDLVIVNLYPFAKVIQQEGTALDEAIENIDIGGPTLLRAAAKNMSWVGVLVDPNDYATLIAELNATKALSFATRQHWAAKAFQHTAEYDRIIHRYLTAGDDAFPEQLNLSLQKKLPLRYGENPHQTACAYQFTEGAPGLLSAKLHQGKQLSYNNIADADAAINCVREFDQPACAVVKHATPCGVAMADELEHALLNALNADAQSAFGGIVALNRPCDELIASMLKEVFIEVLIAPAYTAAALALLASKSNLRVLELTLSLPPDRFEYKFINGGCLMQEQDTHIISMNDLRAVTDLQPSTDDIKSLLFAWPVLKHIKSNAILIAKNKMSVGIGAGQVSRVDAVNIALKKAGQQAVGAVLASDAFFPFRDSIDQIAGSGIRAIIQPGGSMRDEEVIAACNEHGIAMVFTGKRCFKH